MLIVVDRAGRIVWANEQACALTGRSRESLIGSEIEALVPSHVQEVHRSLRAGFHDAVRRRAMERSPALRLRRVDGTELDVEIALASISSEDGESLVLATVRDVSDRIRQRRHYEATLREIAARSPALALVVRDGRLAFTNARVVALLGATASTLLDQPLESFVASPVSLAELLDPARSVLEVALRGSGRGPTLVELEPAVPVELEGGPAWLLVGVDRTELVQLRERNAVAERVLVHGALAAGLVHELATPLQTALYCVEELAAEDLAADERAASLGDARASLAHMQRVLDDMRGVESAPTGTVLRDAVETALRFAARAIEVTGADVEHDVPAHVVVKGQKQRIVQVVANLLVNASHAVADVDTRAVRVFVDASDADPTWVDLVVVDRGVGIAPELVERVFDPFFTTRQSARGTGLGLWICRSIAQGLGGDVLLRSELGRGTEVRVRLERAS